MTNSELAILSLIAETPRHGYEIEQVLESRGMREWTDLGFSSIYFNLKKLEKAGLISAQIEIQAGQGPARKVYSITPAGLEAWRAGTIDALAEPVQRPSPFLLGLSNLPGIPPAEARSALERYRDRLRAHRDRVQARWDDQRDGLPEHVGWMFDYSINLIQTELDWITDLIDKLEANRGDI
jgi:DNA-binding PadR family transcriptional regulator